jgi:NAD(P)-dependent dehydrogenase (short-subunit alcohol dehydrogenase family)
LALHYAKEGALLSLCGRNGPNLGKCADACAAVGQRPRTALFDVRDESALKGWIEAEDAHAPLDLVFANAGICRGLGPDGLEDPKDSSETFKVNTIASTLTAVFAAEAMLRRGSGQIAIISSQASRIPLLNTPSYSASKAGSRFYGLSMRDSLANSGVRLSVVCPGYIKSPMTDSFKGPMPFIWTAEKAASHISKKLKKNPAIIRFPWQLNFMLGLYGVIPGFLCRWLGRRFSFKVIHGG